MSPRLKRGFTLAIFSRSGKIPVNRHWLIIIVSGLDSSFPIALSSLFDISSLPDEFLYLENASAISSPLVRSSTAADGPLLRPLNSSASLQKSRELEFIQLSAILIPLICLSRFRTESTFP